MIRADDNMVRVEGISSNIFKEWMYTTKCVKNLMMDNDTSLDSVTNRLLISGLFAAIPSDGTENILLDCMHIFDKMSDGIEEDTSDTCDTEV